MAIVRQLTTLLDFKEDMTGLNRYEAGLARVKSIAAGILSAAGIQLGIEKIIEFADGLADAGKEINKITAQIKLILRPMDDINTITQGVYDLSQKLGVSYTHMLDVYRDFANEVRDTKIPTEDILAAVENIQKGFEVARATPEQQQQVMDALQRGFRSGKMRPVSIGLMKDILPPEAFNMLLRQFNLGVGDAAEEKLRDLAKEGKITAEAVVEAFKQTSGALDAQWEQVPQKLNRVFARIYNDLSKASAAIYKLVDASVFMGKVIWAVWVRMRDAVVSFTAAIGGLKNLIEILGYVLAVALGPWLIRQLSLAGVATLRWALANAVLLASWLAIGIAIVAAAVAIQDFVYWIQGKPSLISTWVGPFEDLAKNITNLPILKPLKGFQEIFQGDFTQGFDDLMSSLGRVDSAILLLGISIAAVGTAFLAWNAIKFAGLLLGLRGVGAEIAAVEAVAAGAGAKANAAVPVPTGGSPAPGASPGITPAAAPGTTPASPGTTPAAAPSAKTLPGVTLGTVVGSVLAGIYGQEWIQWGVDKVRDTIAGEEGYSLKNRDPNKAADLEKWRTQGASDFWDFIKNMSGAPDKNGGVSYIPGNLTPGAIVPPGALAPTSNTEVNIGGINNNIKIETSPDAGIIGDMVTKRMNEVNDRLINNMSREIGRGSPRIEAPTQ